jgi:hypothetical protein
MKDVGIAVRGHLITRENTSSSEKRSISKKRIRRVINKKGKKAASYSIGCKR